MLDILRKKSSTFGVYLTFAILIVVFAVGFGGPQKACNNSGPGERAGGTYVKVDGDKIDSDLVHMAEQLTGDSGDPKRGFTEQNARFRYQTRYAFMNLYGPFSGAAYGTDPAQLSPIKLTKVVDDLIETKLVSQYAKSLGLGVSKGELNNALALLLSNETFRDAKTGALDVNAYRNWVARSLESSVASFEQLVEDELLREKVIQLMVGEITASDADVEQQWKLENDKVTIEYTTVDERSAAPLVPVTDAEVGDWLAKNDAKVKSEYDKLKASKYTTPKSWKLRGVKFDAPDPGDTDDADQKKSFTDERAAAKAKAQKALDDLKATLAAKTPPPPPTPSPDGTPPSAFDPIGAFAAVATAQSDDASKAEGGALAPATLDQLGSDPYGPNVKAAAEALKIGEPSEVLEVPSGFWILMPEAITDEKVQAYDEVKTALAKTLLQKEKVAPFEQTLADDILAEAKKDPKKKLDDVMTAINAKYGVPDKTIGAATTSFARLARLAQGYPASSPYLIELGGRAPELVFAAFAASADKPLLDKVYKVGEQGKLVIARFVEVKPAEAMKDDDKKELRQTMSLELRRDVYRGWYEDLLAKKKASGDVAVTSTYEDERKQEEQQFVQSGGQLPGVVALPDKAGAAPK